MNEFIKKVLKKTYIYTLHLKYEAHLLQKRIKYFQQEGCEMLESVSNVFHKNNIPFWLEFGTLLGYYREHDFIKHDFDIDLGVYLKDAENVRKALTQAGFELVREFKCLKDEGREETYLFKHSTCDIFYFRENDEKRYCNSFSLKKGAKKKFLTNIPSTVKEISVPKANLIEVEFKNVRVWIPENTDEYLRCHYGKDFMIPNSKFDYRKEATNINYYTYEENPACAFLKM